MTSRPRIDDSKHVTQALIFDVPEVAASSRMAATTERCCRERDIGFRRLDVWTETESVRSHRVLAGPAVVLMAGATEVARLVGPANRRRLERLFARNAPIRVHGPTVVDRST